MKCEPGAYTIDDLKRDQGFAGDDGDPKGRPPVGAAATKAEYDIASAWVG